MFTSKLSNTRKLSRLSAPLPSYTDTHPTGQFDSQAAKQATMIQTPRQLPACCALCSKKVQPTPSLCDISEQTQKGRMCIVHTLHIIVKAAAAAVVVAGIAARNHLN